MTDNFKPHHSWRESLLIYKHPRVISMLFLGFSAGLPLYLVFGTLSFWLREAEIDRATIGFLSWVGLAYAFKWTWSPLVDRLPIPWLNNALGRRRSWLLLAQITIACSLAAMALTDPAQGLQLIVIFAVITAFASATQDIALDAYRIEAVEPDYQAAMSASYMAGYRIAMIASSAGALAIAGFFDTNEATYEHTPWLYSYLIMAGAMFVGIITTLLIKEPVVKINTEAALNETKTTEYFKSLNIPIWVSNIFIWIHNAIINPFWDFFKRYGWHALLILLLIGTYRISDIVLGVMSNPFYKDLGFTKSEVAAISKVYGVIMTLVGAGLGGLLMARFGVIIILFLGALMTAVTNLLFALLAIMGHDLTWLTLVISLDNLSAGIATAAFIAYLSSLTNISYTATQYALFSSMMLLFPKFIAGFSGVFVNHFGYVNFFISASLLGFPVLILIILAAKYMPTKHINT